MEKIDLQSLVTLYTDEMYAWAVHKLSDETLARDIVQDAFLAAAERAHAFKGESSPKTWLFSILNFKIIDVYRKRARVTKEINESEFQTYFDETGGWREEAAPSQWDDDKNLLDDPEFITVLNECMELLPEHWLTCIQSKYFTDKSGEQICQELGITSTNYWQIVRRAKLQLRNCVETNWMEG